MACTEKNGLNLSRDFKPHKKLDFNPLIPSIELPPSDTDRKLTEHWMLSFKVSQEVGGRGGNNLAVLRARHFIKMS